MLNRLKNFALVAVAALAISGGAAGVAYSAGEAHHDLSELWIDGAGIYFGTDNDVLVRWDGTDLDWLAAADNAVIKFGAAGNSFDLWFYGSDADHPLIFDASADDLIFYDGVSAVFGTGSDVVMAWDGTDFDVLGAADDQVINIGNGTNSFDVKTFGNIATAYTYFDASANDLRFYGPTRFTNNTLSTRYGLRWVAGSRGKPGINADINSATEATREIADPDFEILGTNGVSNSTSFYAEGGIVLTTAGAADDQVILLPHLDANQSGWALVTWGTDKETEWECDITTGASVTNVIIWAGLKLTNTPTVATDNDSIYFRFEDDVNSGKWQTNYSIGGTDTTADSGVTAVAINTRYHIKIAIDASRIGRMYMNGALIASSTALTDATDLIPYIGIENDGGAGAAKALRVHGQAISRVCN